MQRDYQSPELRELRDQQIRFAPRVKKLQQVEAAERLIAEIDSDKTYPYEYVCFRVTGYRPTEPRRAKSRATIYDTICGFSWKTCLTLRIWQPTISANRCSPSKSWPSSSMF